MAAVTNLGPGRPMKDVLPASASRLSVQVSPESQQIFNEIMKEKDIKDRSRAMDEIIKEYGLKVKGMKPAMIRHGKIIQTSDEDIPIENFRNEGESSDSSIESVKDLLNIKIQEAKHKQLLHTLSSMDGGGGNMGEIDQYINSIMKMKMMEKITEENQYQGNPTQEMMNQIMPLYMLKMLDKQAGGGDNQLILMMQKELSDLKGSLKNNGSSDYAKQLERKLEKMEDQHKYQELIKMVTEQGGGQRSALDMIRMIEETKSKNSAELERARLDYQRKIDEINGQNLRRLEIELDRVKNDANTGIGSYVRQEAEKTMLENIKRGFNAAKEEKSSGEIAQELISSTIEAIRDPILAPIGNAVAHKMATEQGYVQQSHVMQQPNQNMQIDPAAMAEEGFTMPPQQPTTTSSPVENLKGYGAGNK